MDYERKYKEALERAKYYYAKGYFMINAPLEEIFPELAESEDERIRKDIRDFICWSTDRGYITKEQVEKSNSWLAWLEKQGETTSTDDFGEFINILSKQFPEVSFAKLSRIAVRVKKWLEKQGSPVLSNSQNNGKNAWSEEDEEHIESILKRLDGMCKKGATFTETCFAVNQDMDWLKSLKDRVRPQPKQEWNEGDEEIKNFLIALVEWAKSYASSGVTVEEAKTVLNWLKYLKDKV